MAGPSEALQSSMRRGLALKLAVCLVGSTAGFFGLAGYFNLEYEKRSFESFTLVSADRVSDIILRSTRHEMLKNDRETMRAHMRDIGSEPGIRRVRIFNKTASSLFPRTRRRPERQSTRTPKPVTNATRVRRRWCA